MAKPQLEDGFTPIANEILEKLARMPLAPNQWRVLLCIIRKTYGFHLKVDYIANFQIAEATGLCKEVVSRCLKGLNELQLIIRKGKYIGFQKDWEKWLAVQSTLDLKLAVQSTKEKLAEPSTKVSSHALSPSPLIPPTPLQNIKDSVHPKKQHYFFDNILLTEKEYKKLVERYGKEGLRNRLEDLSLYMKSKGKTYKDHYATVLSWERLENKRKGGQSGTHRQGSRQLIPRNQYTKPEDFKT